MIIKKGLFVAVGLLLFQACRKVFESPLPQSKSIVRPAVAVFSSTPSTPTPTACGLPQITTQPVGSLSANVGQAVYMSVSASNATGYQWVKNGGNIPNATNANYAISTAALSDSGTYYCIVFNACGGGLTTSQTVSSTCAVSVSSPPVNCLVPVFYSQPQGSVNNAGDTVTLSVSVSNYTALQWYKDGAMISNATANVYTISNINASHSGLYNCVASNVCDGGNIPASTTSNTASVSIAQSSYQHYQQGNTYYLADSGVTVGIDLSKGGVMSELRDANKNYVNRHDTGRYNGISLYSQPEPYSVAGGNVGNYPLAGWNPVQAGDDGNNSPDIIQSNYDSAFQSFYVKNHPLQWKFTNKIAETEVMAESWYKLLVGKKCLKVTQRVTINRSNPNTYNGQAIETPFGYFTRELDRIWSYEGNAPFTGQSPTLTTNYQYQNQFGEANTVTYPNGNENWIALTNNADYGVGLIYPEFPVSDKFRVHKLMSGASASGEFDNPTILLQATTSYTQSPQMALTFTYYWCIGTVSEIRQTAYDIKNGLF